MKFKLVLNILFKKLNVYLVAGFGWSLSTVNFGLYTEIGQFIAIMLTIAFLTYRVFNERRRFIAPKKKHDY